MKTLTTTEITLSLQTIVLVISVVVSATLYVNHIEEHDTKQVGSWYRQSDALETVRLNSYKDRLSLAKVKEGVDGTR